MKLSNGKKEGPCRLLFWFVKMVIIQRHITSVINYPVRFVMQVHMLSCLLMGKLGNEGQVVGTFYFFLGQSQVPPATGSTKFILVKEIEIVNGKYGLCPAIKRPVPGNGGGHMPEIVFSRSEPVEFIATALDG